MPIADTDILLRLSGGAAQSDPNASLGGAMSSVAIVDNTLHNLFDRVSGAESTAGDTEYRCFYVLNNHATLPLQAAKIWIDSETSHAGENVTMALDGGAMNATAEGPVADENTAPSGESFVEAATEGAALTIGDIPATQKKAIWLKRVTGAGTLAKSNYTVVIKVKGDTAE